MSKKIKIIIQGNDNDEHTTYVEHEGKYYKFYDDGYEGISAKEVRGFLEFLGYEVFELHNSNFKLPSTCVNNQSQ